MRIERDQMEEGVPNRLEGSRVPGLNGTVGQRGTGKTSPIDLVWFLPRREGICGGFGKTKPGSRACHSGQRSGHCHAGRWRARIPCRVHGIRRFPRTSGSHVLPILSSPTEIETVGLRAQVRSRLLVSFDGDHEATEAQDSAADREARSLTAEAEALRPETDELADPIEEIARVGRDHQGRSGERPAIDTLGVKFQTKSTPTCPSDVVACWRIHDQELHTGT